MTPTHAPYPCSGRVGCPNLVERAGQKCSECRADGAAHRYDDHRPGPRARGYTKRWERFRSEWLAGEPFCRTCRRPGRNVDHVIPHRGAEWLFWLDGNHQTLCDSDHARKTALEARQPIDLMYPLELPRPARPTYLVCGPDIGFHAPAKGTVIHEQTGLVHRDRIPEGLRLEDPVAHLEWRNGALLEELPRDGRDAGELWLVTAAPRIAERAFWSHVLGCPANLIEPPHELPPWWWQSYKRDREAQAAIDRRRGRA